ncbi:hypothetical protein BKA62DRAFT_826937 [Auriculariales sp. MPI-PUGE-AT-0066]|nr:hypothetical protein BKA62DRAFT_826937 [Auriculariales sp. MPI-PUGE-AT-0066]
MEALKEAQNTPEATLDRPPVDGEGDDARDSREEVALDSDEKIGLEAFLQRKEWIEDKCQVLENMPPIDVFAGLEQLLSSEPVNGLPSRKQLQDWLKEHDAIEKETVQFDTGDMIRLKKFAKAATNKHLSPADTDLIEVTLNTLLGLDKLLHLLRARGDTLELLGLRLTWEEQRTTSWVERQNLLDQLRDFLVSRARWSPATYERFAASNAHGSTASTDAAILDRSLRYKHTELLSHDAAQFTGMVIALRNAHVNPSGKTLDRLIEASTKGPVPDPILDEQDKVEDKCINELEGLGQFAINSVMQWKRADELYGELKKDQITADTIESEVRAALLGHPTVKLDTAFSSRTQQLIRRLQLIGDPRSLSSSFPRPSHPLFSDQQAANDAITGLLSDELHKTVKQARAAEAKARQYHLNLIAVQRVESARQNIASLKSQLVEVAKFLKDGDGSQENGSPPDLGTHACLDPLAHAAFLAILPSTLSRLSSLETSATRALSEAESGLTTLPSSGIDPSFRLETVNEMDGLKQALSEMLELRNSISSRVTDLQSARQVWETTADIASELDSIHDDIVAAVKRQQYFGRFNSSGAPLTPDSPPRSLRGDASKTTIMPAAALDRLRSAALRIQCDIDSPLQGLTMRVPPPLSSHLSGAARAAQEYAADTTSLIDVWGRVAIQAQSMADLHAGASRIGQAIDDTKQVISETEQQLLAAKEKPNPPSSSDEELSAAVAEHHLTVQTFLASMTSRVSMLQQDLSHIDVAARSDCNGVAMNLAGNLQGLDRAMERLGIARLAVRAEAAVSSWSSQISDGERTLKELGEELTIISNLSSDKRSRLDALRTRLGVELDTCRSAIGRSRSPVRELVERMQSAAASIGTMSLEDAIVRRVRQFEDVGRRLDSLDEGITALREQCSTAQIAELERLQELERLRREEEERIRRLAEEERLRQEEEERLRREEEERLRREEERLRKEEEERLRQEEERFRQEEQERLRKEEEDRRRIAYEAELRHAEEERRRLEEEERQRIAAEDERRRLAAEEEQRQRIAAEEKERSRQEEERRRIAAEEVERQRLAAEELERQRLAAEELERQRLAAEELERQRLAAEEVERQRLAAEEVERQRLAEEERQRKLSEQRLAEEAALRRQEEEEERLRREQEERNEERDKIADLGWECKQEFDENATVDHGEPAIAFPASSTDINDSQLPAHRLLARVEELRIPYLVDPASGALLPTEDEAQSLRLAFTSLEEEITSLLNADTTEAADATVQLRQEYQRSRSLLPRLALLGKFAETVTLCDNALSDLLEHIDSYPVAPINELVASHRSNSRLPSNEQLTARITFTKHALEDMQSDCDAIGDDPRVTSEKDRIQQTWTELYDMAMDRITGNNSRPPSVADSFASTSSSRSRVLAAPSMPLPRKGSNISIGNGRPSSSTGLLRASKGSFDASRPTSKTSTRLASTLLSKSTSAIGLSSKNLAAKGTTTKSSSAIGSTFSSRQRTTSLSSQAAQPPPRRREASPTRPPSSASKLGRGTSSIPRAQSRASTAESQRSTFARAPRFSMSTSRPQPKRTKYVANAKSKLDVAVGDVINRLPEGMAVNIEPVSWQDNSGKYWIGDAEPKLCFCRILRSQTVMVRVGGGWMELSRFIKNHFASLYRMLPEVEDPLRRSIVARALGCNGDSCRRRDLAAAQDPEPKSPPTSTGVPSFSLSTPSGASALSLPSSGGSPLTPLQFMRRADEGTPPTPGGSMTRSPRKALVSGPATPNGSVLLGRSVGSSTPVPPTGSLLLGRSVGYSMPSTPSGSLLLGRSVGSSTPGPSSASLMLARSVSPNTNTNNNIPSMPGRVWRP